MQVCLVSKDKHIESLCREAVNAISGAGFVLAPGAGLQDLHPDVCIWDSGPAAVLPQYLEIRDEVRYLFLANPTELPSLHSRYPGNALAVVLKPVSPKVLRDAVRRTCDKLRSEPLPGAGGGAGEPNASRDGLLECLLLASLKIQQHSIERTNFIARALHDFRTPLTAANGYCGLLLDHVLGALNAAQTDTLQRMQHSIQRLSRLSKAMFQLSVGQIDGQEPHIHPAEIDACVEQAVYEIMPAADAKDIEISIRIDQPPLPLCFDPCQIEQVLINLLENACKFTPASGTVSVRGYPAAWTFRDDYFGGTPDKGADESEMPNAYRIDVIDSGPGIPPEHINTIFEHYVSYAGSKDRSGTGLGLAICKLIMAGHHGEVFAESRSDGAIFSFVLPLAGTELKDGEVETGQLNAV
jgi:signal transduction histidine kinase